MALEDITSDELKVFLGTIGWTPGRRVDISSDLRAWSEKDYQVPTTVREFMAECGGLRFDYPRHPAVGGSHWCEISGATSAGWVARSMVAAHEERLGLVLCPVGLTASRNMVLLMDADGVTYGIHDHFVAKIADDGYRAMAAIWRTEAMTPLT